MQKNTAMAPLPSLTKFLLLVLLVAAAAASSSFADYACKPSCGAIPIHYPFGAGPGCGSPLFHPHVACAAADHHQDQLTFTTRSGSYPVDAVDYANQILYVSDPSMSTCAATNPSRGFSLDWDAPFAFADSRNIFALLDCFPNNPNLNSTTLCDTASSPVCGLLYTCPAIAALGAPVSTCCVYTPASLGPAFDIDLTELRCASYAAVRGFNGAETRPDEWEFGIALKYRFSADDGFPSACADCEKSGGVCGYAAATATATVYDSFACSCGNGMNSSTNCYFAASAAASMSGGSARLRVSPPSVELGLWLTCIWLAIAWTQLQF